jgi:hypothetical protein
MPEHLTIGKVVENEFYDDHHIYNAANNLTRIGAYSQNLEAHYSQFLIN